MKCRHPIHALIKSALLICSLILSQLTVADELGRLFFTPQERARLTVEYNKQDRGTGLSNTGEIAVNGIVQKHGGSRTIWVNGQAQAASKEEPDPSSAQIILPGQIQPVKIKVGERGNLSADKKNHD
ncbi:MAG: hypothetical protein PHY62_08140 [Gallionella sp.]|nr:hypothetical protein [Gallionella sp.]